MHIVAAASPPQSGQSPPMALSRLHTMTSTSSLSAPAAEVLEPLASQPILELKLRFASCRLLPYHLTLQEELVARKYFPLVLFLIFIMYIQHILSRLLCLSFCIVFFDFHINMVSTSGTAIVVQSAKHHGKNIF